MEDSNWDLKEQIGQLIIALERIDKILMKIWHNMNLGGE
jgi:hypothetical protein